MTYSSPQDPGPAPRASLRRSTTDRLVAGVAGGLAQYFGVDPVLVRVGFVVGSLFLGGVGGPLLYLLAWAIVPEEGRATSIASETLGGR
ncbi:MAG TPA: PspC domain-containing protein [Acidimicrobiales bacterium]|nr:PspC domain-containing protein [Acidimicrobiales bacterium]